MIALTFALPAESSGVVGALRGKRIDDQISYGKLADHDMAIFHTGVGRQACERRISEFLRAVHPQLLISSGFAGGVGDNLKVGDLIVAKNFSDPDLAMVLEGGAPATPLSGSQELAPPTNSGIKAHSVKLFTAASIVDSIEERNRIARGNGAEAVDMETEIIARACAAQGIRMLSLRVISDTPGEPFPLPPNVLFDIERQKTNLGGLLTHLATNPLALARLIRFSRQIGKARKQLTAGIIGVVGMQL